MILGGDQPWTRRVIGVSTCPQVGSMFNEGIWNAQKKTWEGSAIPRTMEGDEANYTAFLLGLGHANSPSPYPQAGLHGAILSPPPPPKTGYEFCT